MRLFKTNAAGDALTDSAIFKGAGEPVVEWTRPIELKQGPDGAIYLLEYYSYHATSPLTHIGRYEYKGSCHPGDPVSAAGPRAKPRPGVRIAARTLSVSRPGPHVLRLRTLEGREVAVYRGEGPAEYSLPPAESAGMRILTSEPDGDRWILPGL
jgi:hypothetical protein